MPLNVTSGYAWTPGASVTPTKLNETGSGTVADNQTYKFASGSTGSPPISFNSDTNTGVYNPGSDAVGVVVGGTEMVRVTSDGIGVGTTIPGNRIHASSPSAVAVSIQVTNGSTGGAGGDGLTVGLLSTGEALINQQEALPLTMRVNGTDRLKITSAGNVGIANGTPTEKLDVTGNIKASGSLIGSVGTLGSMGCRAVTITTGAPSGGSDGDIHFQYV